MVKIESSAGWFWMYYGSLVGVTSFSKVVVVS